MPTPPVPTAAAEPGPGTDPRDGTGKPMRLSTLLRLHGAAEGLHTEAAAANLDAGAQVLLANLHTRLLDELSAALHPAVRAELAPFITPLSVDASTTGVELRVATAGLSGWLGALVQQARDSVLSGARGGAAPRTRTEPVHRPGGDGYL